jgi:F-type H+-transporting ATPase subunit b
MKINWFTVIAQVINFLILVWLLRRFLYKPVLKAIDERENKIASQLKDARAKETEAKKEQEEFQKKNEDFNQKKKGLMDKAVAETNVEREKLLEAARDEATGLRSKLDIALKESQENLNRVIAQKTQEEVFAIARKTLADLASLSLEEQSANIFIKRLNELTIVEKKQFIQAFKTSSGPILIRSAFDLPAKQQAEIKSAVDVILETKSIFQFKTAPELISGIELAANGFKLAWSISEYLNSLQNRISETMKEELKKESKDDSKPESKDEPKSGSKDESKPKQKDKPKSGPKAKPKIRKKAKPEKK